ncbi:cell division protein FtsL [Apilactobacillus sp. TMW 2.2459]|uniref:cell division protein FtsL n=1 Tax=Apilactobacillus xinyiensis TaxID=2841032 RepID=UPI001C7D522D|nr:cell division protein FtsL [Apilactobacillus xinyiensis]MCL0312423.1 cell division protein FtsL [Apilactobacillus xinyiensis]
MAQNNLASRQQEVYFPENQKRNKQPKKYNENVKLFSLKLSKFEKLTLIIGFFVVFILTITLLSAKVNLGNVSNGLNETIIELDKYHNDNSNLKQQVGELQNSNRLQKIANKNGLSLSNDNVRNVVK